MTAPGSTKQHPRPPTASQNTRAPSVAVGKQRGSG